MEEKTFRYDGDLRIEAYRFQGYAQPFPLHFHPEYVLGLVEGGGRRLTCKSREWDIGPGDLLLFNPGDLHACVQSGGVLSYRSLSIPMEVMLDLAQAVTGERKLPVFSQTVLQDSCLAARLASLHDMVLGGAPALEKDEALLLLTAELIRICGVTVPREPAAGAIDVEPICAYICGHLSERIRLDHLCRRAGVSSSTLLRAFGRAKGVTPYQYLESVRISEAKDLLDQGLPPAEVALRAGFTDQSHFTNCFTRFLGLSPGAYREQAAEKHLRKGTEHGPVN